MAHFHKNLPSGDKNKMRELWSARQMLSDDDIPQELKEGVKFVSEDVVSYSDKGETINATTFRGTLLRAIEAIAMISLV